MDYETKIITIKSTRFQFNKTNFQGEPDPTYGNTDRVANIVVPPAMVPELEAAGINVKSWPRELEEGQEPTYFVKVKISWRDKFGELKPERYWPHVRAYEGRRSRPIELDEESIDMIDKRLSFVEEISVRLSPWKNSKGGITLFIQDMSVLFNPNGDPFGDMYGARTDEDETLPFA